MKLFARLVLAVALLTAVPAFAAEPEKPLTYDELIEQRGRLRERRDTYANMMSANIGAIEIRLKEIEEELTKLRAPADTKGKTK